MPVRSGIMHAVIMREFGPAGVLEPGGVAGVRAGPGEVVIDVEVANVTFVETQVRAGKPPHPAMLPALPAILGNGVGGTVAEVGADVDSSLIGRKAVASLTGTGGYAERACSPASQLIEVPQPLALRDAVAVLADGRTALALVSRAQLRQGDTVLVEAAAARVGALLLPPPPHACAPALALAPERPQAS